LEQVKISGEKIKDILKLKLIKLKLTIRYKISDVFCGTNDFKKGYHPRTNVINYENDD